MNAMQIDLRTDPRASALWYRLSPWVDAMAELLEDDIPPLISTRYAALLYSMHPVQSMCSIDNQTAKIQKAVAKKRALAQSIKHDGYRHDTSEITVRRHEEPDWLEFIDGTHRACCLLVLGEPVIAEIAETIPRFDPLEVYPLK
jgi:hypothetical protein